MPLRRTRRMARIASSSRQPSVVSAAERGSEPYPTDGSPTGVSASCPCTSHSTSTPPPEEEEEKEEEEAMVCGGRIARLFLCACLPTVGRKCGCRF